MKQKSKQRKKKHTTATKKKAYTKIKRTENFDIRNKPWTGNNFDVTPGIVTTGNLDQKTGSIDPEKIKIIDL